MGKENHNLTKSRRLKQARRWIKNTGVTKKGIVSKYTHKFHVSNACAIKELAMLGIVISEEYKETLKRQEQMRIEKRKQRQREEQEEFAEGFFFIAGYTSWGFPYGIECDEDTDNQEEMMIDDPTLPF